MANKFKKWAQKVTANDGSSLRRTFAGPEVVQTPVQQPIVNAHGHPVAPANYHPMPQPAGAIAYAPAPAPSYVQIAQGGIGQYAPAPENIDPIPPSNVIVKPDAECGDRYEQLMASVPDIAKSHGIDMANGFDAMELAGLPAGVSVEDWKPTTRYYNGVTDQSAPGRLETAFGRHQVSSAIRSSKGMQNHGTQQASRTPMRWTPPQ